MGFHKSQIFFYLLSAFIIGVFLASIFNFSQSFVFVILIVAISVVALVLPLKNSNFSRAGLLVVFLFIALLTGIVRFNQFNLTENSLEKFIGQEVALNGHIDNEPEIGGNRARFVFKTNNEKVLVTTNAFPKREFGDELSAKGILEFPQNFTEFDYVAYLRRDGIKTILFYPKIEDRSVDLKWSESLRVLIYKYIFTVKNKFQNAINLSIPEPNAAFINGILLGSRQNIPKDLREAFNKTGTTHILAISGYNIMIISWAVLGGLIFFFKRRVAFWILVGVIFLFVILTGASASVVRAAVMGLLLSFAHGYGRLYDQKNSIILAGAVMIYHNPSVLVFDIGFQLSFSAVLGLIYIYPRLDHKLYKIPQIGGLKKLILMTISAQVAVAPPLIYYFGNFSIVSFPTNILILPFVPAAMLTGFVAGLAGMVNQSFGQVIGYIAWAITMYQIQIVEFFSF